MSNPTTQVILKRFEHPDEVREMAMGRFELVDAWSRAIILRDCMGLTR